MNLLNRFALQIFCALGAWFFPLADVATTASAGDDAASLQNAAKNFFKDFASEDESKIFTHWSADSPHLAAWKSTLPGFFASGEYTFADFRFSRLQVETDKALLRVRAKQTSSKGRTAETKTKKQQVTQVFSSMEFVRRNGQWKVWSIRPAVYDLLGLLFGADSQWARQSIVDADRELAKDQLVQTLLVMTRSAYTTKHRSRALQAAQLAASSARPNRFTKKASKYTSRLTIAPSRQK